MERRTKGLIALTASTTLAGVVYVSVPTHIEAAQGAGGVQMSGLPPQAAEQAQLAGAAAQAQGSQGGQQNPIQTNLTQLVAEGQQTFRFDTFGDEAFWGDTLKLHLAIEGADLGGVGNGVSPKSALALGLKVDMDELPAGLVDQINAGQVDLDDPATTLALLQRNAVVGVTGFFDANGGLRSIGIQCALCHSTVDDAFMPGIGHRLDGVANRDLNVGAIVNSSPDLGAVVKLLQKGDPTLTEADVRNVLLSWGPGKFDAELLLDGKAFNPQQVTNGVVTGTNVSGATLLPNAFGLAGFNQHTWTGAWGDVTYWNAFVANIEMHGVGTFYDPRLDDAAKYPIAAAAGFGHLTAPPDEDRITRKLPGLHVFQLAIPAPKPTPGVDFDPNGAARGRELFVGKAKCSSCHVTPLSTEPGYNLHTPEEMKIDAFEASRAPDNRYKTMNLAGLFIAERGLFMRPENKGRFYHDGRFATLLDVVKSYDDRLNLGLSSSEQADLVEYLKSL